LATEEDEVAAQLLAKGIELAVELVVTDDTGELDAGCALELITGAEPGLVLFDPLPPPPQALIMPAMAITIGSFAWERACKCMVGLVVIVRFIGPILTLGKPM